MDFKGIHFADPVWLLGLGILPLAGLIVFFLSRAKHATFSLGNPRMVKLASGLLSPQMIPPILRFVVLALCLIAAARPQAGQKKVEEKRPVTDLFVDLDVSGSMITNDLQPNRIIAAKKILAEFLEQVQNVRMGLTIFARVSFTQCPLTTDIGLLKQLLANVELSSVKLDGTAIGDSMVSCLNRLKNGTGKKGVPASDNPSMVSKLFGEKTEAKDEGANNQAIILLTDGVDNASQINPLAAAKIAVAQGVKVYAIGIGGQKRVPALATYPDGHVGPYIDQRTGQMAMSEPLDMSLLNEIARLTGGKSYAATDNRALQSILGEIAKLEKRDVSVTTHWEYQELASFFLLAAFLILALDIALETTILRTLP